MSLAVNVLIARRLGTEQYGRLALMIMASQVLLLVAVNWTHAGFVRFGSREYASRGVVTDTFWSRIGILVFTAGLGLAGAVVFRQALAAYLTIPVNLVWLLLAHFLATCSLSVVGGVLQASDRMARYGVCLFMDKTVMLLLLLALPAELTRSPFVVLGSYAFSSAAVSIWGVSVVGFQTLRPVLPKQGTYMELVRFSTPLWLSSWAGLFGANWFDLVILKWYVPLSAIGVFSLGTQLAGVVQQITVIFSTLLLPHLSVMVAERREERIRVLMERLLPYWLLGTSTLFTLVLLGARVGLPIVFGPDFGDAAPVLAVLMVATGALALFNAVTPLVTAYGSTWTLTGICLASAVANVLLDLILIPRFGIVGSAGATALAYGISATLVIVFVQRRLGGRVLRLSWLSAPIVASCTCFLLIDGVWFYPAAVAAAASCILLLVIRFRLFDREDAVFLTQLQIPGLSSLRDRSPVETGS